MAIIPSFAFVVPHLSRHPLQAGHNVAPLSLSNDSNESNRDFNFNLQNPLENQNFNLPNPLENQKSAAEVYSAARQGLGLEDKHFLESSLFVSTPLLAGIASFFLYPTTSIWFHNTVNYLSNKNWEPVDGGQLQWSILLPALNGVVMTAISLLYANMISTTGTQLRNRQISIHEMLSTEVEGIRGLVQLIKYYPEDAKQTFANHLYQYTVTLVDEIYNVDTQDLKSNSQSLSNYRDDLHFLSTRPNDNMHSNIMERSYETLSSICNARTARVTSLQTRFPFLHYVTITALTVAILLIFLLETDRKVILFLDKFQIRSVWALLVSTVTAIYCIGFDLAYPFIGTYTVPADQLLENDELIRLIGGAATTTSSSSESQVDGGETGKWQEERPEQDGDFPLLQSCDIQAKPTTANSQGQVNFNSGGESSHEPAADGGMSLYDEYMRSRTCLDLAP